ncbi:PP2C family protein-serine/threonine phosphatase [Leifsonia sp. Leaf264]|uniref:PP2C family protein-serine/threonine phosphatase n=1 Tax=Leifsonia sp. Leaf264 TaxID=1736314 RepID=UPI0006F48127|nr:PP2C family serine/threonine-protein phosphatase [Leifsonia sp. Leaf264]KQO95720.1 protein phosphatase [Leifsonia sp. Leaf264]
MATLIDSAAVSNVGRVRANNQDSGFAGHGLFLVADGMGGHAGGDVASAIATKRIAEADQSYLTPEDAEFAMQAALIAANQQLAETVFEHAELTGMGTTVSAIYVLGDKVAIAHIGDSRIYLLRGGTLTQITTDHTFVQRLVDSGRITEEEAAVHPRRSVLMRVLGDVESSPEIDTSIVRTIAGDRWLICSDGLSGVVSFDDIREALEQSTSATEAAERLVKESLDGGAPDNVTVVVVDIGADGAPASAKPVVIVGSAAEPLAFDIEEPPRRALRMPPFRLHSVPEAHFEPDSEEYLDELIEEDKRRVRRRRITWITVIVLFVAAAAIIVAITYNWTQSRYFVGSDGDSVAIFRGIQQDIGPISLHSVYKDTNIPIDSLTFYDRQAVEATISATSLDDAITIAKRLEVTGAD